tara:strand:+ start:184 stop:501 length:318 start_codon:yes stop_codon:yes gene_type:complete
MKVKIWIKQKDAKSGRVYPGMYFSNKLPSNINLEDVVEVIITSDEYTQLVDSKQTKESVDKFWSEESDTDIEQEWLIDQYNRNRPQKDWIQNADEMDQNNQPFGD